MTINYNFTSFISINVHFAGENYIYWSESKCMYDTPVCGWLKVHFIDSLWLVVKRLFDIYHQYILLSKIKLTSNAATCFMYDTVRYRLNNKYPSN